MKEYRFFEAAMRAVYRSVCVVLSLLGTTAAHAEETACAPILMFAEDVPIPLGQIQIDEILTFAGGREEKLQILLSHAASVTIQGMPNAYVGLADSVVTCMAGGCDAFVYITSDGVSAMSSVFAVDSNTIIQMIDYSVPVPDQAIWPGEFARRLIVPEWQVIALLHTSSKIIFLDWANVSALFPLDPEDRAWFVDYWVSVGDDTITIPFYLLRESDLLVELGPGAHYNCN